ncbi:PLAT domain-containing protein 3-like [Salvia miltiorrhiza]|uniref:PLAT domain-containing protein 3-like n=1 Tax=Salvia miltiorrhiza TaxID=226208 RepID=UPI0025AC7938|nr:PLAT domain-containing protein 3-like [Salvia miltiorrhiza]
MRRINMEIKHLSFNLLILFSFIIHTNANASDCIYNIYVETGNIPYAETSSNITIFLRDNTKAELPVVNLRNWGLMGSAHHYFRPGEVDLFAGKGPCLRGPVCSLIIVLDGYDSWYCHSIQIITVGFGKSCSYKHFVVKKWLDVNAGSAVILQDECCYDAISFKTGY